MAFDGRKTLETGPLLQREADISPATKQGREEKRRYPSHPGIVSNGYFYTQTYGHTVEACVPDHFRGNGKVHRLCIYSTAVLHGMCLCVPLTKQRGSFSAPMPLVLGIFYAPVLFRRQHHRQHTPMRVHRRSTPCNVYPVAMVQNNKPVRRTSRNPTFGGGLLLLLLFLQRVAVRPRYLVCWGDGCFQLYLLQMTSL